MNRLETQLVLDLGQREAYGREDFLVAPCNAEVVAWLDRWPDWPGHGLIIHGPAGCGKTHLAQVFRAVSDAKVVRVEDLAADDHQFASSVHVIVEDIGVAAPMQALLHLYNSVVEGGGTALFTSRSAPSTWQFELADLRSRMNALATTTVGLPDDALLAAVVVKLLADRQLKVGEDVVMYLVRHMERSFQAARRIVVALDDASLAVHREITVPLARKILERHHNLEKDQQWTSE